MEKSYSDLPIRTFEKALAQAIKHWSKLLRSMADIAIAGFDEKDTKFTIERESGNIRVIFSPKIMNLLNALDIDEFGKVSKKTQKFLKRHGKKAEIEFIINAYKPETCIACEKAITVSEHTNLHCVEGSLVLVTAHLEVLQLYLNLQIKDEEKAVRLLKEECKRVGRLKKTFVKIMFERDTDEARISTIIRKKGSREHRSLNFFYPSTGESIRTKIPEILGSIKKNLPK